MWTIYNHNSVAKNVETNYILFNCLTMNVSRSDAIMNTKNESAY